MQHKARIESFFGLDFSLFVTKNDDINHLNDWDENFV